ncbi:helix-turn-helix transcriptional regulator [Xenorhabdus bovienii]|uniref:XRE family transcriptional regulator n=1 Tax=Xenorhabdus bovienii TaxID=40576 RepID=UPI001EDD4CBA|nr:helix-turn-helix transcriptional regulator [Xenorhabdus bovienii]MCG3462813.1 helix-turn-helix transcriptional regulator [Xenorhabdus bovienii]
MEPTTLAKRLKYALSLRGYTQSDLAEKVGITQGAINKLTSGRAKSSTKIIEIAEALSISPEWLAHGNTNYPSAPLEHNDCFRVNSLDITATSSTDRLFSSEFIQTVKAVEYTVDQAQTLFGNRPADVIKVITVHSDSMANTIEPGDQIFVDTSINQFDGDGVYLFVLAESLQVKRLQKQGHRMAVLSDNPLYKEWYIEQNEDIQLNIIAKVLLCQPQKMKRFA